MPSDSLSFDQSLRDVLERLDEVPARVEANLIRGALRAAAKPILEDARSNVPSHSGKLKASLRITSAIKKNAGEIFAQVKAGNKTAYYAHMVEYGTKHHTIKGPVVIGGHVLTNIEHPGAGPKPFMRPAFDRSGQASVDAYAAYMARNIDKAIEKNQQGD